MMTLSLHEFQDALEIAARALAGDGQPSLVATAEGWNWYPNAGENVPGDFHPVHIRPGSRHHILLLDPQLPAANQPPTDARTDGLLLDWLLQNASLPGGVSLTVDRHFRALLRAAIPAHGYSPEELAESLIALLPGFHQVTSITSDSSTAAAEIDSELIEAWARDAGIKVTAADNDSDEFGQTFSVKMPGFEPARLLVTDRLELRIGASPLLDSLQDPQLAETCTTACALLAFGATQQASMVRPLLDPRGTGTLFYQAVSPMRGKLPPVAWLTRVQRELRDTLACSRNELGSLYGSPRLAELYLSTRGFHPKAVPSS